MTLYEMQKQVFQNKVDKGFNVTNVEKEFCGLYGEVGEAYDAYRKKKDDLGEELADVAIYLLGLSEMLGFKLHDEIEKKMEINRNRKYEIKNGVLLKK
jgi:NTP pyrophosphatase (non-canonical NTP hydrolase)